MVGKLTYDQVLEIAKDLRAQVEVIERLLVKKLERRIAIIMAI